MTVKYKEYIKHAKVPVLILNEFNLYNNFKKSGNKRDLLLFISTSMDYKFTHIKMCFRVADP